MELSVIQISHVIFPDRSSSFFSSGTKLSSLEFIHGVWSGVHIRALVSTILLQSLDYCKTKYQDDNQTGHQQKHMWASCLFYWVLVTFVPLINLPTQNPNFAYTIRYDDAHETDVFSQFLSWDHIIILDIVIIALVGYYTVQCIRGARGFTVVRDDKEKKTLVDDNELNGLQK